MLTIISQRFAGTRNRLWNTLLPRLRQRQCAHDGKNVFNVRIVPSSTSLGHCQFFKSYCIEKKCENTEEAHGEKGCIREKAETTSKLVAKLTGRFQLVFTCKKCNTRNTTHISKLSYQKGVVIVCCQGCSANHLIADNLKWFSDDKQNIEGILAEKGECVMKISNHQVFLEVVPPDTPDQLQKGYNSKSNTTLLT